MLVANTVDLFPLLQKNKPMSPTAGCGRKDDVGSLGVAVKEDAVAEFSKATTALVQVLRIDSSSNFTNCFVHLIFHYHAEYPPHHRNPRFTAILAAANANFISTTVQIHSVPIGGVCFITA
jgi:hypothetical protein